jgi:hypothetical protein
MMEAILLLAHAQVRDSEKISQLPGVFAGKSPSLSRQLSRVLQFLHGFRAAPGFQQLVSEGQCWRQ